MGLFKKGRVWWMRFTYRGKQERKSTETRDRRLAKKIYCKVITDITEGKWFKRKIGDEKTFREMVEKYLVEYSISKTSSGQIRDNIIARWLNSFFGDFMVNEITPSMIVDYKAQRRKEEKAPATIEREICLMKRAYNLAIKEWEWTNENPVSKVSREKFNNQIDRYLAPDEEE